MTLRSFRRRPRPAARPLPALLGLLALPLLGGCRTEVPFYERQAFSDPSMAFESDPAQVHFTAKTLFSMEGSIGGVGTSGGGGCGCY
jgi:hypothetical protein